MLRRWIALVCCGLILFPAESSAAQGGESPALTPHPCDVVPPGEIDGSTIWCAALDVSLDRADRADPGGPQVTLAVAVLRSSAASPAPDPVLFLGGDAGLSVLAPDSLADLAARVAPFRAQRDVILFDPRGAGLSGPRFACAPGVATDLEACLVDLAARGLKPEQFTASALASDAAALMHALDYPAYNLYGLSYGAQVALALLAEPASADRVRSIVLDAALPLPISTLTPYHAAFELARYEVFRSAFALCDADPDCSGAYPYMRERFVTLVAQSLNGPITLPDGTVVTYEDLYRTLYPYNPRIGTLAYEPALIYDLSMRHNDVRSEALALPDDRPPFLAAPGDEPSLPGTIGECAAVPFAQPREAFERELRATTIPPFLIGAALDRYDAGLARCAALDLDHAGALRFDAPLAVNPPTLILHGSLDAVAPIAATYEIAALLPGAVTVEFPAAGHGLLGAHGDCAAAIAQQFWHDPQSTPDLRCVASGGIAFILPGWY